MRRIATGLEFPEGPVWTGDGTIVLTEIRRGTITQVDVDTGEATVVSTPGGGPVGANVGPDGNLYVCQNGGSSWTVRPWPSESTRIFESLLPTKALAPNTGAIQRISLKTGEVATVYGLGVNGAALSRPNDIVFDKRGNFYFSDMGTVSHGAAGSGTVYYGELDGSGLRVVAQGVDLPNGVGLSPDGTTLYFSETMRGALWRVGVDAGRVTHQPEVIGQAPKEEKSGFGGFDSMVVDAEGNVLVASLGPGGISVYRPNGELAERLETPDPVTTNACFGGPSLHQLYVTMSSSGVLGAFDRDVPGMPPLFEKQM